MTTIEDIERAIERLPGAELAKLRDWFDAFEAARFDRRIEADAASGKLDTLAQAALAEFREGTIEPIKPYQ
jgi:hypothetical protein